MIRGKKDNNSGGAGIPQIKIAKEELVMALEDHCGGMNWYLKMNCPAAELRGINDFLTNPLSPPLFKIEGDDHPPNSPSLGKVLSKIV